MQSFEEHWQWFKQYVAAQRAKEPNDPTPLDLKFEHTQHVLENARYIVRKEGLSGTLAWASELAALYHDLGRFEQYLRYRTFKDKLSESHGLLGVKIIKKTGCLGQESPVVQKLVRVAVGLNNF
ncbi:MAG: HD domain-containing protein, partial [Desulfovibrio sp.]|nr:HD domain-containing protein [Desulfovibrio sp.]